jgi:hypothetical protein
MAETQTDIAQYQSDHDLLIRVDQKVSDLVSKFDAREKEYVTRAEFWPVKTLVYGCVVLMLTSVVSALLYLVIHH